MGAVNPGGKFTEKPEKKTERGRIREKA